METTREEREQLRNTLSAIKTGQAFGNVTPWKQIERLVNDADRLAAIERQVLWRTEDMPKGVSAWQKYTLTGASEGNRKYRCVWHHVDGKYLTAPDYRPDEGGPIWLPIIEPPDSGIAQSGEGWQYYWKQKNCPAQYAEDENCICWYREGTGPHPSARHDDPESSFLRLQWRKAQSGEGRDHGQCPKCERPLETRTLILCPDCDVRITPSKAAAPEPDPEKKREGPDCPPKPDNPWA